MSAKLIKKADREKKNCDTMNGSRLLMGDSAALRDYLMTFRQTLLMNLSALDKLLQLRHRCRHCGSDL